MRYSSSDLSTTPPFIVIGLELNLGLMLIRLAIQSYLMSLFSNVGRKFEKTKQAFIEGGRAEYACVSCEKPVDEEHEYCPHCGEETVEPVD